jgi:PPP family 3-phenylpropionic acid transporter
VPYWRLSNYYFFYFASLGALLPYWALYLNSEGFSARQIGELMAVVMATKIISPNIWGWMADHTGRRMAIVRAGSLLSILCFAGLYLGEGYLWLLLVMVSFSFFWNATLPQFEVATLRHLGEEHHRYSAIRLWGSVGFICTVGGLGWLFDGWLAIDSLPLILLGLFVAIWLSSLVVPEQSAGHLQLDHESLLQVVKRPHVATLLIACFLMQAGHGTYYTFYTLYMEGMGYSRSLVGQLWALGVVAEVGLFLVMYRLIHRFGQLPLLKLSFLVAGIRWLLIALFPQHLWLMLIAQLMHAATFGIYHATAIALIHKYFPGSHQGKGQALYSSLSFGAGGALGAWYSGLIWEQAGAGWAFASAALVSLIGFLILQKEHNEDRQTVTG